MKREVKYFLQILLGLILIGIGCLVGLLEIIALIDPVGTKMSDDADPFGNPYIPWYIHACYIIFVLACFGFSFWLFYRAEKNPVNLK